MCVITTLQVKDDHGVDAAHISCTVEMLPTTERFDVAVIDEIQMIGDEDRGWAWTRAFLGCQADEVHLCGDQSTGSWFIMEVCVCVCVCVWMKEHARHS